jgi:hypothetical protein
MRLCFNFLELYGGRDGRVAAGIFVRTQGLDSFTMRA